MEEVRTAPRRRPRAVAPSGDHALTAVGRRDDVHGVSSPLSMNDPPPPRRRDGHHTLAEREREAIAAARRRYEGSWLEHLTAHLKTFDFVNSVVLIGAALLLSVLPLLILLSSIANERIDDDLSRHIGLNSQGSHIIEHLFRHSPSHAAGPLILGLLLAF